MLRRDLCCSGLTGPAPGCCPPPAQQAQQEALDLISDWSQQEMDYLREEVGLRFGLKIFYMLHCVVDCTSFSCWAMMYSQAQPVPRLG